MHCKTENQARCIWKQSKPDKCELFQTRLWLYLCRRLNKQINSFFLIMLILPRTLEIPAKSSGWGYNAVQMWKCLKGKREHPSLSQDSPNTLMTMICLGVVVGMTHSAVVTSQLHNWSYRPNSLKEDLLVLGGFCHRSCFHKWGSLVHVIYRGKKNLNYGENCIWARFLEWE